MTAPTTALFRVGQRIDQLIDGRCVSSTVARVFPGYVALQSGGMGWAEVQEEDLEIILPPNVGVRDANRRPWPKTTGAVVQRVEQILDAQRLDAAWVSACTPLASPAWHVHVFVPSWQAPIEHVRDLVAAYFPYTGFETDIHESPLAGRCLSQTFTIRKKEQL